MLHLGIDLHQSQITIVLLDAAGDVLRRGTIPTEPATIDQFLASVRDQAAEAGGYRAILEECGFTHWLIKALKAHGCDLIVVVQPLKKQRHKTDRRDAAKLAEILWINRDRLQAGSRLHGIRQVMVPTEEERQNRLLTNARIRTVQQRTRIINRIKAILRQFNLLRLCPAQGIQTNRARAWLCTIELPDADRLTVDLTLEQWECLDRQIKQLDQEIERRAEASAAAQLVKTIPGAGNLTALALACRIGSIDRFPRPSSLANMFGLTPSINDTGDSTGRLGAITKHGHPHVRFLLGQMVAHVVKADARYREIYRKIRRRRGPKTAMVAMMRRLACMLWHMFKTGEVCRIGNAPPDPAPTPSGDRRPLRGHLRTPVVGVGTGSA